MPKKKITHIAFLLDETGSMQIIRDKTISGFNEYVETVQKNGENTVMTFTKFNSSKTDVVYKSEPIKKVAKLSYETYEPNHLTPLYDAVARTIKAVEDDVKKSKAAALMVIMTDGEENDSKEYDSKQVFEIIRDKEKEGWTFAFLGANQDAWAQGQKMGLRAGNVVNFAGRNVRDAMTYAGANTTAYVSVVKTSGTTAQTTTFFKDKKKKEKELTK
jgi:uncharacterized protein YegL